MQKRGVLMKLLTLLLVGTLVFGAVDRTLPYPIKIDAEEVAKQVYFVNHQFYLNNQLIKAQGISSVLVVKRAAGKKPRVLRAERYLNNDYSDGVTKSKDLIVFLSGNLQGTGLLLREFVDEQKSLEVLMWLPALRKVRRMAEPSKNIGYSAADVAFVEEAKLRRLSEDNYEIMQKSTIDFEFGQMQLKDSEKDRFTKILPQDKVTLQAEVYLLKAIPKEAAWYDYRLDYVDVKHFTVYRSDFYKENEIIKRIDRQWSKVAGIDDPRAYMWNYWYSITPETKFETLNYIPLNIIQINNKIINPSFWSESTLHKLK